MIKPMRGKLKEVRYFFDLVPFSIVVKSASIIMVAPLMMLMIFSFYNFISPEHAFYGAIFIFVLSIIFIFPYVMNLAALTRYVNELAQDKKAKQPDLSFLNNVEKLSEAVNTLHDSWDTRKRKLENAVHESEILVDSIPDILIMLDSDLKIVRTNRKAQEVFGGKNFKTILNSIIAYKELQSAIKRALKTGVGEEVEYMLQEPFRRQYTVRVERFPSYSQGSIALIVAMHDITQQKHTEQMLSDFVANASHEIRTPLTSIMGFIETLQTTAKNDAKVREEFLEIMRTQSSRMVKLINDLLSLSQIERNISHKPDGEVTLVPLVEEAIQQQEMAANQKEIIIKFSHDKKLPKVQGDAHEISLVIDNLLSNAIKYSKEGTEVTVSLKEGIEGFKDSTLEFDSYVAMTVQDQGIGIESDHIPRLTERFYRIDNARTRKIGGTGLGLAIVKHIVDRHQGRLKIESTVGEGSSFTVLLPVC